MDACQEENSSEKNNIVDGAEVSGIEIDVRDRKIEVSLSDDDQIHIAYFESDKTLYNISVSDDKLLTMVVADDKEWKDYIGSNSEANARKISVQVPDGFLSTLTLKTTNEDVVLPALTVTGDIVLDVSGGNIVFEELSVGNSLNVTVKNGNITGNIIGGWDDFAITYDIKKGESNLPEHKDGGEKSLQVSANNGDVNIEFDKQ